MNEIRSRKALERKQKTCPVCGKTKRHTAEFWYVMRRDPVTREPTKYDNWCKPCRKGYVNARYYSVPGVREARLARVAITALERKQQMADPAFAKEYRAKKAAWNRQWRARKRARREVHFVSGGAELPAAPLAAFVDAEIERRQSNGVAQDHLASIEDVCETLGVSARTLLRWRSQPGAKVRLSMADKVLIGLDLLWWDVWDPVEFPEVADELAA